MKPLKEKGGTHMYQKEDVRKFLDEKQISYEWFDHKAVFTIDEMLEIYVEKGLSPKERKLYASLFGDNNDQ